jgi:hypothetical protein
MAAGPGESRGVHADSELVYDLRPDYDRFVGRVGIDDEKDWHGSIVAKVFVAGKLLGESPLLRGGDAAWGFNLELPKDPEGRASGQLRLVVDSAGDGMGDDLTDWVDAGFVVTDRRARAVVGDQPVR